MLRKRAWMGLLLMILAYVPRAEALLYDIGWVGANGWSLEGQFGFDDSLLGTGPINQSQIDSFAIDVLLNGVSQSTYAGPVENFNFDTNIEQFLVGERQVSSTGQSWNAIDFPSSGAGFASGLASQSVVIDGKTQLDSTINTPASTLTATRSLPPIAYTATIGPSNLVVNEFESGEFEPGMFEAESTLSYSSPNQPLLNADFSANKNVTLRIEAPAGKWFSIDAPDAFNDERSFQFQVGTDGDSPISTGAMTDLTFENLIGTAPDLTGQFDNQDYPE